ncbi:MAG: hypothetical protein VB778_07205 [Nitrospinaceae bacterium]
MSFGEWEAKITDETIYLETPFISDQMQKFTNYSSALAHASVSDISFKEPPLHIKKIDSDDKRKGAWYSIRGV